jgi:hypothetical protein
MIVKLQTPLVALDGNQLKEKDQALTVGNVLAAMLDNRRCESIAERVQCHALAKKCFSIDQLDFTPEELDALRAVVASSTLASNVIVAQVYNALGTAPAIELVA